MTSYTLEMQMSTAQAFDELVDAYGLVGFFRPGDAYGEFSQWYAHPFTMIGPVDRTRRTYPTAEHAVMVAKALVFDDDETAARIMASPSPADAKALGRTVPNYNDRIWAQARVHIAREVNMAKFTSSSELRDLLLSTGEAMLAEAAPRDLIWGTGLGVQRTFELKPSQWRGANLLGRTLMTVRRDICEITSPLE
jgi:ribA/ribD-fused uncharacterized protein